MNNTPYNDSPNIVMVRLCPGAARDGEVRRRGAVQ